MQLTNLKTKYLGRNFKFYETIDSTQEEIWRLIRENQIENGTLIMTDIQTKGKGTHGRTWHTDEAGDIAFSFYIEANCYIDKMEGLTAEIAEILVDIFKEKYDVEVAIKSPNDIIYHNKKIGGILTESKLQGKVVKYLVIGIGINTNKMYFPDDIANIATSIKKEFGKEVNNGEVVVEFCNRFEKVSSWGR